MTANNDHAPTESLETHELCIVGAGIAGLNALVVATTYLPRGTSVALVDSRHRVGGMWVDTYDHVRLHQPHGIFTAGKIKWTLQAPPSHLATKSEVLDHFEHCLDIAKQRLDVRESLGWDYESHRESGDLVEVVLKAPDGRRRTLRAKRLIKAFGHRVLPNEPLAVSSTRVRSITPELLGSHDAELRADDTPIWIVGGGKTAMDAAHLLITTFPGREINMLAGPGTIFTRRDTFFPVGAKRWWSGTPINTMVRQTTRRFDGTNEDEVRDWFRATYGVGPVPAPRDYFGAYMSEAESDLIENGLSTVESEYFADAVDGDAGVELVLRSGDTRPVVPGTWLINCTGSLLRAGELHPYEPLVSPSGRTLSLQMRASTTGVFSSFAGYFMTHLMFTDQLRDVGLYVLDVEDLFTKARPLAIYASMSLSMHNLSVISDALPNKVILDCGLDYDLWYPLPRRMLGTMEFLRTHRRDREHHRQTLDTIRDRFDVRCGPVESS
ncbi:NAD(P)-binding protein [Nocardioides pelophilus]|uniref:NAD(P)-binding protein n=1 Tax=Nocardioides pelophilus TaxID=2172019 RepID=UPI0015FF9A06|nr:potassium transporter [Nocardioides pelophilus]